MKPKRRAEGQEASPPGGLCDTLRPRVISSPSLFSAARRHWAALLGSLLLLPHALYFNFVNDDAYISFRYAKNLAEHGQLVFNLGERVEGFTNFLWTVMLALAMKVGAPPEDASRVLGIAFGMGGLFVVNRITLRLDEGRPRAAHALATVGLALTAAYACWCTGGLETQLFTLLFLLATSAFLLELDGAPENKSAVWFALAGMTRPEGVLLFGLAGFFRLLHMVLAERRWIPTRREVVWVALFLAVFAPYFAWRWWYFGWPLPNTFYVKSSGGAGALPWGLYYLRRFVEDHLLYLLVPLGLAGFAHRHDPRRFRLFCFGTLVLTVFAAYTAKVGGDFMGLYRFVLPVMPLAALMLAESLRHLGRQLQGYVPSALQVTVAVVLLGAYGVGQVKVSEQGMNLIGADRGIDTPGYLKLYADERIAVGRWFAQHARPDDLMTVGGAGVIPYYSGIKSYDVFGLVDEHIAHEPSMTVSQRPGHQKWGSDAYMLSRKPTLITHIYHLHARAADNVEYWRGQGYEWVTATIPGLTAPPLYSFLKRADRAFGPFPATERSP